MQINSQEVTQAPGNNTVFQTWLLSGDENACKKGFERLCALVVNLNKTAKVRFGAEANVNCVIAVGRDAWLKLGLPQPLPKELVNFKSEFSEVIESKFESGSPQNARNLGGFAS